MKSYLTYLYEMELHENECNPPTRPSHKEETIYDELQKALFVLFRLKTSFRLKSK